MSCHKHMDQIVQDENFNQLGSLGVPTVSMESVEYKPFFSVKGIEWRMNNLLGHILTTIDASIVDPTQRKAVKDIIKNQTYRLMEQLRTEAYNPTDGCVGSANPVVSEEKA